MSDIFYTSVDKNLQQELNARAASGRFNRTTKDIDFMVSKTANVVLIPYKGQVRNQDEIIKEAVLGGTTVRSGEYLPSGKNGFLSDRTFTITDNSTGLNTTSPTPQERTNTSRRIPPFLTSLDISIGDHSMGLLNSATLNFTIPNPQRDLNYMESVYFRPGRHVTVIIECGKNAIITDETTKGYLSDDIMPSEEKLNNIFPGFTEDEIRRYQKMNSYIFEGQIISFNLSYNKDASVSATLSMKGASQVYTDLNLIPGESEADKKKKAAEKAKKKKELEDRKKQEAYAASLKAQKDQTLFNTYQAQKKVAREKRVKEREEQKKADELKRKSLYTLINTQVESEIVSKTGKAVQPIGILAPDGYNKAENKSIGPQPEQPRGAVREGFFKSVIEQELFIKEKFQKKKIDVYCVFGEPYKGAGEQRYINLAWLIYILNNNLLKNKMWSNTKNAQIICTKNEDLCISNYYESLVSSHPENVFFPRRQQYGPLIWFPTLFSTKNGNTKYPKDYPKFADKSKKLSYFTDIFINMDRIKKHIYELSESGKPSLNSLLANISNDINSASGNAISLKLITHPNHQECLLYYDSKKVKDPLNNTPVIPYSVPMFANHPAGTIVREFSFSGKLPSDAANLSYALNQDISEVSESDIAPFLSYMYSANTVERTGPNETIGNLITPEQLEDIKLKYRETHLKYIDELFAAKIKFGNSPNKDNRISLRDVLKKHIQYPTDDIILSNQTAAPTIPFTTSFTIDGINGFRYGDVLMFDGLPDRYKNNVVFSVLKINHTVSTNGEWKTQIDCIMRPNITT